MLRSVVLAVANRGFVRRAATGGAGRRVALRFVAGERLDEAIEVARALNASGIDVALDCLGENVTDPAQARAARDSYIEAIERISVESLRSGVSVKLTQMGLDLDEALATANVGAIARAAASAGTSVVLDMEDHRYTDRTVEACLALAASHPGRVGVAIQAYLRRSPDDLDRLTAARAPVRLCKGAYREPRAIAFARRSEVRAAFASLAVNLLESESYAMIATHDEALVEHAIRQARRLGRDVSTFEFQMLHGVRRDLQRGLVDRGYRVRVYVPFGVHWYPYLMRRIAERPSNLRFFAEALARG